MKKYSLLIILFIVFSVNAQEKSKKFSLALNAGIGVSYTDRAFLFNLPAAIEITYNLSENYDIQFAPKYSWLIKWNEHYLSLPIHLKRNLGKRISLFAGPAISFDIGYFKDLGVSAGAYYHINKKSSFIISTFTFTLYDYKIDYLFIPIGLSYSYMII